MWLGGCFEAEALPGVAFDDEHGLLVGEGFADGKDAPGAVRMDLELLATVAVEVEEDFGVGEAVQGGIALRGYEVVDRGGGGFGGGPWGVWDRDIVRASEYAAIPAAFLWQGFES